MLKRVQHDNTRRMTVGKGTTPLALLSRGEKNTKRYGQVWNRYLREARKTERHGCFTLFNMTNRLKALMLKRVQHDNTRRMTVGKGTTPLRSPLKRSEKHQKARTGLEPVPTKGKKGRKAWMFHVVQHDEQVKGIDAETSPA